MVAVLAIGAAVLYAKQSTEKANEGVVIEAHVKGNPDAAVTLVEYSDFQCPACAQFYPIINEILAEHFPLINIHPHAVPAARAAEAAGQQDKFWEMHDKLFENQTTWSRSSNPVAFFNQYAEEIGLDMGTYRRHFGASVITDSINKSFDEARSYGFNGTPSFLLNGEEMTFETFEEFRSMIEEAISEAE